MTAETDEELMLKYCEGSTEAFHKLYSRYSSRVYGYLRNRLRNPALLDEVFQEVFLKLHKSRASYDPKYKFAPWLFVISKSVVVDHLRGVQRNQETLVAEVPEMLSEPLSSSTALGSNSPVDLSSLSGRDAQVVRMRFEEDLEFEEIAERLGLKGTAVRQIISRAIRKLKVSLVNPKEKVR